MARFKARHAVVTHREYLEKIATDEIGRDHLRVHLIELT